MVCTQCKLELYILLIQCSNVHTHERERPVETSSHFLSVPFCNTVLQHRLSVAAPLVWNSLPLDLRTANSLPVFNNNLKTFLFRRDFK